MNIYEAAGAPPLDIAAAVDELRKAEAITDRNTRRDTLAILQTAAMLDIASSLRVLADESRLAMGEAVAPEPEPDDELDDDALGVGDLVAVDGLDDPAEIIAFGETEGSAYAVIRLVDGTETRAWLDVLTRLRGDERDDDAMQEASEAETPEDVAAKLAELNRDADGEPDLEDDDFTPPAEVDPLEVLKAKSKKKGSKK